jgi:hypothetical protein
LDNFGDTHVLKSFKSFKEKEKWWTGRLIMVKKTMNNLYIKTPSLDEVGIVIGIQETTIGCHLEVFFSASNATSWMITSDVYSQTDKK